MERVVPIPEGVEVTPTTTGFKVKGKLGELERDFDMSLIKTEKRGDSIALIMDKERPRRKEKAMLGTIAAHLKNMIKGVSEGFEYRMKIIYTHFPMNVSVQGNEVVIKNFFGEKHPRKARIVGQTKVEIKGQEIVLTGINKEEVGQTAANIEQATRTRHRDVRKFQDGIYITSKGG